MKRANPGLAFVRLQASEVRRKEGTGVPPNFREGGTGDPACEASLNGLKGRRKGEGGHVLVSNYINLYIDSGII